MLNLWLGITAAATSIATIVLVNIFSPNEQKATRTLNACLVIGLAWVLVGTFVPVIGHQISNKFAEVNVLGFGVFLIIIGLARWVMSRYKTAV